MLTKTQKTRLTEKLGIVTTRQTIWTRTPEFQHHRAQGDEQKSLLVLYINLLHAQTLVTTTTFTCSSTMPSVNSFHRKDHDIPLHLAFKCPLLAQNLVVQLAVICFCNVQTLASKTPPSYRGERSTFYRGWRRCHGGSSSQYWNTGLSQTQRLPLMPRSNMLRGYNDRCS